MKLRIFQVLMGGLIVSVLCCSKASAGLDYNVSRTVVLYDASRSMYPGYNPGEHPNPRPPYFHERTEFVQWLFGFMASQAEKFGARRIELDAFYNVGQQPNIRIDSLLQTESLEELHALAGPAGGSQRGRAIFESIGRAHADQAVGQRTYLLEALKQVQGNWDGIIWLITDNVVEEAGRDSPEAADVDGFFYHLRDEPRYCSVHVFSYPYNMDGRAGTLAVYGIIVSSERPEQSVHESLDSRFFDMVNAFPRGKHLKLRDLNVSPLEFSPVCTVRLFTDESFFSNEGHRLDIDHTAAITSNLTQHSLVSGAYSVFTGEFQPVGNQAAAYGVQPLPAEVLGESRGDLPVLPPEGSVSINGTLEGRQKLHLRGMGFLSKLKWALSGEPIRYEGDIHIQLTNLKLNFEPQRLDEIYGMSRAPAIFGINSGIAGLSDQQVARHITISVTPPYIMGWLILMVLLFLLALVGSAIWFFFRSSNYRISKAGDSTVVSLRPLGNYSVRHEGLLLGILRRRMSKDFIFVPNNGPGLQVEAQNDPGSWRAVLSASGEDKKVLLLKIEGLNGGKPCKFTGGGVSSGSGATNSPPSGGVGPRPAPPKAKPPGFR
jgi:hypothetical protein